MWIISHLRRIGIIITILIQLLWIAEPSQSGLALQDDADISGIAVASIAWSPDGSRIAVGKGRQICGANYGDPRFAILILNTNGQIINNLVKARCTASAIAWSPDGLTLVSIHYDGSVFFWNGLTGAFLCSDSISLEGSSFLLWSPDSKTFYTIGDHSIYAYDTIARVRSGQFADFRTKNNTAIALSPDGSKLASGDEDGIIRILSTATRQMLLSFAVQTMTPTALDWSPTGAGSRIASGFSDGSVKIWDASNGSMLTELAGHVGSITVVTWSPTGDRIATASYDGTVRLWNASTGTEVKHLQYPGRVLALDWSPDGTQLAYGGIRSDYQDTSPLLAAAPIVPTGTPSPTSTHTPTPTPTTGFPTDGALGSGWSGSTGGR